MSRDARKSVFGFSTRSDTNQAAQPPKMARGLKFLLYEDEGLYYLCSENKGAFVFAYAKKRFSQDAAQIVFDPCGVQSRVWNSLASVAEHCHFTYFSLKLQSNHT